MTYLRRPNPEPGNDSPDVPVRTAIAFLISKRLSDGRWIGSTTSELVDLRGLDLAFTDLADIRLEGCRLDRLNVLEANLSGANLRGARLADARFIRTNLTDTVFSYARLIEADFRLSIWRRTQFDHADLTGAKIRFVNGPTTPEAISTDGWVFALTRENVLKHATLIRAEIDSSYLNGSDFSGAELTASYISYSLFSESVFDGADLKYARVRGSNFSDAKLDAIVRREHIGFGIQSDPSTLWPETSPPLNLNIKEDVYFPEHFADRPGGDPEDYQWT